jgi:putative ATP-dependent endonuclease of the OLD family
MELLAFRVSGFRSLANTQELPLHKPTILTGANDGGKTASLDALAFLLGEQRLSEEDRTFARVGDPQAVVADDGHFADTAVVGRFRLNESERQDLGLPDEVQIRRIARGGSDAQYEIWRRVSEDERLRGLDTATIPQLRAAASELGVAPEGDARRPEAYRNPLSSLAAAGPQVEVWEPAPRALAQMLPRYLRFSSTREPDPQMEIQQALRGAFEALLEDDELVGPVRKVEETIRERLTEAAEELCAHIRQRCPELKEIEIEPNVSFREGFGNVNVRTARTTTENVALTHSGAGRLRRITLAVWEWTRHVLSSDTQRHVVVAYDEPDTHLDYGHQRDLAELIRDQAALDHVRVIVATHSLNLIDKVDIADVVHLRLVDDRTAVERLLSDDHEATDQHLVNIAAAMGLRNSVLLHERCFVGVEGPTETQSLPMIFRAATGMSLQSTGIALLPGNGNRGALQVARYLNEHGRRVHFLVDNDSSTDTSTRRLFSPDSLQAIGLTDEQIHLVGAPNELEELFSNEQWADTANAAWRRVDGQDWVEDDFDALRSQGKFSSQLEEMVRPNALESPSGKPGYLFELASRLNGPEDVPAQLRQTFETLAEAANT